MAVGKCKECGGLLSSTAKACPHCGAQAQKKTSVVTWIFLAILGSSALSIAIKMATPKTAEQVAADAARAVSLAEENKKSLAIASAQNSVKKQLKDPASAKFGTVIYSESGYVCGYVNAKNSFGAYSGSQAFLMTEAGLGAWLNDGTDLFKVSWNKHCGG